MKLKNICLGIACIAVVSACSDKMDYHEYTSYDKGYVFSDFSRTAGFGSSSNLVVSFSPLI